MRHKPGISKHYSTMRNFYNLICLDTCETYESFVGDFFLLFFLWIDSTLTFDLLPWSDETLSARLNFFGGLILQILGEIIRKKKRFWTSWGHKFSLLFMDIRYYSANKNLQPTFFMIFPSQLNGILVRWGVLRICKWQGGSNNPLGFKQPPPSPKRKKIPGPKFNPQNVPYRIFKPLKFSESILKMI